MAAQATSVLDAITAAMVVMIQGLGLVANNQVTRKLLPHVGEGIDSPPCIQVCAGEPEDDDPRDFELGQYLVYPVEVDIIAAVNRDYVTQLPTFMQWRKQIRQLFIPAGVGGAAPTVWQTRWYAKPLFDRGDLNAQYGFIWSAFRFHSAE